MKGIFRVFSAIVLILALVGAVYLVRKNQETRRGATAAETSSSILPDTIKVAADRSFEAHVWLNTGKDTDKLSGAEFVVKYDASKVRYISSEPQNGYSILNDNVDDGKGRLTLKMVTMATGKGGATDVLKITFQSLGGVSGSLVVENGKVLVDGQNTTWDIAKNNPSNYGGAGRITITPSTKPTPGVQCNWCGDMCRDSRMGMACTANTVPPEGKSCVAENGSCVIRDNKIANEGEMCGGITGIRCNKGLVCKMPTLPSGMKRPIPVDQTGVCVKEKTSLTCNWCGDMCRDSRMGMACTANTVPPEGKTCVAENGSCVIKDSRPTPSVVPVCGARCTSNAACGSGMICAPIWWPCDNLPVAIGAKLQADAPIDANTVAELRKICPKFDGVLPKNYVSGSSARMPTFYGVCRNVTCPANPSCKCGGIFPTPTPTVTGPIPTITLADEAKLGLKFEIPYGSSSVNVGDEVILELSADVGNMSSDTVVNKKISAVNTRFKYDPASFDVVDIQMEGRGSELKKVIDKTAGTITIYYVWNLPADRLFNRYTVAKIKLKAKTIGQKIVNFDSSYNHEVSGLNEKGQSVGFRVTTFATGSLVVKDINKCLVCATGLVKGMGNANCDNQINSVDFEMWRNEMFDQGGIGGVPKSTWQANFNCGEGQGQDLFVSGIDFEIWRKSVFN